MFVCRLGFLRRPAVLTNIQRVLVVEFVMRLLAAVLAKSCDDTPHAILRPKKQF